MNYSTLSAEDVLTKFSTSPEGLNGQEADRRLRQYGRNELKFRQAGKFWAFVFEPLLNLFTLVLAIAAGLSWVSGHLIDAVIIGLVILINAVINWSQRASSEKILAALRKYEISNSKVRRDGQATLLDSTLLVPGDIVLLEEGDKIPGDGRLIDAVNLQIDESQLTGESTSVSKDTGVLAADLPIFSQTNMVFKGTYVTTGSGLLCIVATGNLTQLGTIAKLSQEPQPQAPIQRKIDHLTFRLILISGALSLATFGLGILRGYNTAELVRFVMAMAVAIVPEGLPIVITVVLLLGVRRMSARKAVVRQLAAVETLGMITAIAADKTGTLTQNRLTVEQFIGHGRSSDELKKLARFAVGHSGQHGDPIDRAIASTQEAVVSAGWQETAILPFQTQLKMSATIWRTGSSHEMFVKGAPENLIARTTLSPGEKSRTLDDVDRLAAEGYRVIAFGRKSLTNAPNDINELDLGKLEFLGLAALADELRPNVVAAIRATQLAGIKVFMLTGDHAQTAAAISQRLKLISAPNQVILGQDLETSGLGKILKTARVFARVLPEHKFKLLNALKQTEIVAMTGDGVNDAPALTKADVGIAMGSGTDVAKQSADIILLDDNYATIVEAIKEGRTIYQNISKMLFHVLSTNLGEALTMVGALIIGLPLPVTAVQLLWINLVTDTSAAIPLGLDPHEKHYMTTPPRPANAPLLPRILIWRLGIISFTMAAVTLGFFSLYLPQGIAKAQTVAFMALVIMQWANALNARSQNASVFEGFKRPNYYLIFGLGVAMTLQALLVWTPLGKFLQLVSLTASDWYLLLLPALAIIGVSELHKLVARR